MNYYNEVDPYAAAWLRELIVAGLIPSGHVDERSIIDVKAGDLAGYTQCHFFAGIGGWSHALQLAGWPSGRQVWTGSCPCQPFSSSGKREGFNDERHLWPIWHNLIRQRKPDVVFGEQVASTDGLKWLDLVWSDMEAQGYAFGACDICAASVGAPHIRQRLWFVGHLAGWGGGGLPTPNITRLQGHREPGKLDDKERRQGKAGYRTESGMDGRMADADAAARDASKSRTDLGQPTSSSPDKPWRDPDWLFCRDERWRPVEPGTFPLADGLPKGVVHSCDFGVSQEARTMRLRGYGNAIVPQVAAQFIRSVV